MKKNIAVMKFGGTSLMTYNQRYAASKRIIEMKNSGKFPVVVVSAMGRFGDSYATDTLIGMLKDENEACDKRNIDMIASCGETISAALLSETIRKMGYESVALNGAQAGIYTDSSFGDAKVLSVDAGNMTKWINKGHIVVVTGFQGVEHEGFATTLGRGGSDFSAVVLSKALKADIVYIIKDVPGVLTADPKITEKAHLIQKLSYDELYEMSKSGAKVVNFKAVTYAKDNSIELVVKSLYSPIDEKGTQISGCNRKDAFSTNEEKLLTAIVSKDGVLQYGLKERDSFKIIDLLNRLSKNEISIDMINIGIENQYFTIDENNKKLTESILKNIELDYALRSGCSKLTIVGQAIHGVPGVMAKLLCSLDKSGIEVFQTSDSNATISCIIDSNNIIAATEKIHDVFKL